MNYISPAFLSNLNSPASRYQNLKIIQRTVRIPSSLYTMNIGALSSLQPPAAFEPNLKAISNFGSPYFTAGGYGVCWNQMSDRAVPHKSHAVVANGTTYHTSSTKHSITRFRPGSLSPGGEGVDIKHNAYFRYYNRIKAQGPLLSGPISDAILLPHIPYNRAFPIKGDKVTKTGISNKCICRPSSASGRDLQGTTLAAIYGAAVNDSIPNLQKAQNYTFHIGDAVSVYSPINNNTKPFHATIISITKDQLWYTVKLDNGSVETKEYKDLRIFKACCDPAAADDIFIHDFPITFVDDNFTHSCGYLNTATFELAGLIVDATS